MLVVAIGLRARRSNKEVDKGSLHFHFSRKGDPSDAGGQVVVPHVFLRGNKAPQQVARTNKAAKAQAGYARDVLRCASGTC